MVGSAAERDGAIKHGSKMIQAVANARVAKLTIVLGSSFAPATTACAGGVFLPPSSFLGQPRALR
jgi:geranyl-CoA carboxylase beta subunit